MSTFSVKGTDVDVDSIMTTIRKRISEKRKGLYTEEEVREITQQMQEGAVKPKPKILFETGESVKVIDGPFQDFSGVVEDVKPEKGKLRVLISIFGRATPVELEYSQVEKL